MALVAKEAIKFIRASTPSTIALEPHIGLVLADPTRLHQIVMNLHQRPAHAMRESGGVMRIGLANCDVADDGVAAPMKGWFPAHMCA